MIIRMIKDRVGSVNGYTINQYLAGQEYDMGKSDSHRELAQVFIRANHAEIVVEKAEKIENVDILEPKPAIVKNGKGKK